MKIMIFFLILTVISIIATIVYLKQIKNKNIEQKKFDEFLIKGKSKSKKQLAQLFNFKIIDNIISLGNRYSIILKLGNIDYNMLSDSEQDAIENVLIQTALSIDYPVQFFSTTEYIDTSKIVSLIRENNNKNDKIKEYKEYLISYLENLMNNRTISVVKNYAIISYDGIYENAIDELNRKANSLKASLLRAKILCEILLEDEVYSLIYRELNKNSTVNISTIKDKGGLYVNKKAKRR